MSGLGYREVVGVIEGRMSVEQAKVEMRRVTRVFVRRQANWFKEGDESIRWFRVEDSTVNEIEKLIREVIDF
jgi:tRNA dimethylallyltransferase